MNDQKYGRRRNGMHWACYHLNDLANQFRNSPFRLRHQHLGSWLKHAVDMLTKIEDSLEEASLSAEVDTLRTRIRGPFEAINPQEVLDVRVTPYGGDDGVRLARESWMDRQERVLQDLIPIIVRLERRISDHRSALDRRDVDGLVGERELIRDPSGLLYSRKRYVESDLAELLRIVDSEHPVAVVYCDMNDLKSINDTHGHAAGDAAIHRFVVAMAGVLENEERGYRDEGGDEVVLLLRCAEEEAIRRVRTALVALAGFPIVLGSERFVLTAACGVASAHGSVAAADLIDAADFAQRTAKSASKGHGGRTTQVAVARASDFEVVPSA